MESDILRPEVTITVSPQDGQLHSAAPPDVSFSGGRQDKDINDRGGSTEDEEEDTVIDAHDEKEKDRTYPHQLSSEVPLSSNRTDTHRLVSLETVTYLGRVKHVLSSLW